MRARILPLDDIAESGKTGAVALLLTLSPVEAREIMEELAGGTLAQAESPEELSKDARKLYEALQVIAHPNDATRRAGRDVLNTEGRAGLKGART